MKPGAGYVGQDHAGFTAASGDHRLQLLPLLSRLRERRRARLEGRQGGHAGLHPGGRLPHSAAARHAAGTMALGVSNLPHPTVAAGAACTSCHATASGGRRATGYNHASALALTNCNSCHEAGSDLIGTGWNGATATASGAGDTRPFTLTAITTKATADRLPQHVCRRRLPRGPRVSHGMLHSHGHRVPARGLSSQRDRDEEPLGLQRLPRGRLSKVSSGARPRAGGGAASRTEP